MTEIIAEIGVNHNGLLDVAKRLIDAAAWAGADHVKLQKRTPELHHDPDRIRRGTPWGDISDLEYRQIVEFGEKEYDCIDLHCREHGIGWFMSVWDMPSLEFALRYEPEYVKIPSALITDLELVGNVGRCAERTIMSTGMSTPLQITTAFDRIPKTDLTLMHCHSAYPAPVDELNLRCIRSLKRTYEGVRIGYSGHEQPLEPTVIAVALGAEVVERHITLDRTMWGSDHLASVVPTAFSQLVARIRATEKALGDGEKKVWESEKPHIERLRGTYAVR